MAGGLLVAEVREKGDGVGERRGLGIEEGRLVAAVSQVQRRAAQRIPGFEVEPQARQRSEEHTSELQSLMRISYAVFCLKKKTRQHILKINQSKYNILTVH